MPYYLDDLRILKSQRKYARKIFPFGKYSLCLDDRFVESGIAKGHYFYQDWYVANRIFLNNPEVHLDVGSRVDGFVAHVASFRPIHVIDIRPLKTDVPNIKFIQADLMLPINTALANYCDSLSCLHTVEHFGLGRYGDPIQYDGYIVGLSNIGRLLRQNGKFYFSVPIGPLRMEFNAHRVFSIEYLLELVQEKFQIDYFSFVDDDGDWHANVPLTKDNISVNFGCTYGCGIFELTKL
jgi:SAM-dependent methyltransferase